MEHGRKEFSGNGESCSCLWKVPDQVGIVSPGKQQKGREGVVYETMDDINEKFKTEILLRNSGLPMEDTKGKKEEASSSVKGLEEATDTVAIALNAKKHIKVNKLYLIKATADEDNAGKIWKLDTLSAEGGKLSHQPFFGEVEHKEVTLADLKHLREWNKPQPALVDARVRQELLPCKSAMLDEEMAKANLQCALYDKYKEFLSCMSSIFTCLLVMSCAHTISLYCTPAAQAWRSGCGCLQHPPSICWWKDWQGQGQARALGFVQVVHVDKLLKTSCSIKAPDMEDHCFIITPWRVDFVKRTGAFIPYWMVKEGTSADERCLSRTSIKAGKYSIPAYVNKRLIEQGTPLLVEPAEEKESAPKKRKVGAK